MITAVDSSILLDVLTNDPRNCAGSLSALRGARQTGRIIACPVVWAEVRAHFENAGALWEAFSEAGLVFDPFDQKCADLAGALWREYRRSGGSRAHLIPDFLIGAHAQVRCGVLLARDRGFFRRHFGSLRIVDPSSG
ncbi:MAG: PIN domain-containing protein [Acidobacteria bacterium]|nr:PIN domain-containing protein [Acidobacteriota bacterium]